MGQLVEQGMYFAKKEFIDLIKSVGGECNDVKERPLVALVESKENKDIYWAIPLGDWNHREGPQKKRIQRYLDMDTNTINSCFYHVGKTDKESIFFISDVVPITSKYIERNYYTRGSNHYVIKNKKLIEELQRKIGRIISYEKSYMQSKGNNEFKFRQNIFGIYNALLDELSL